MKHVCKLVTRVQLQMGSDWLENKRNQREPIRLELSP